MEIRPLSAKETANGSGNRTKVGRAQTVYICATADVLITNHTTGFTFQMYENQAIVLQKEKDEEVYAGSADAHFTKIAYPRG
jgi:hypothetical protein|tara:strand:+ start:1314 stop:1559 length:246 start_codon:yes stop_codon:yes gene_type:complete